MSQQNKPQPLPSSIQRNQSMVPDADAKFLPSINAPKSSREVRKSFYKDVLSDDDDSSSLIIPTTQKGNTTQASTFTDNGMQASDNISTSASEQTFRLQQENDQNADTLLENIGLYISANDEKQKDLLDSVTKSLNALSQQEREGIIRGTANAFSAFEKGIDLKAGAKWGGYTAGIGLVSVLGGCLAAAAAQGGDLGANLKDIMSQVFPEALVALAAAALLIAVARTLFGAFSGAAEQIASANDKRIVANAQEQINTALSDITKNPLNVEAFKKLEEATKTLIEHGSTEILDKSDNTGKTMKPIITPDQVKSYKEALQNISQARPYAKLKAVENLLRNEKNGERRDVPMLKAVKNDLKGKSDRNTETNKDYAQRLAQKFGIKMSSTSNTLAPAIANRTEPHKTKNK